MYQIFLLQVKVLLSVEILSTLITDGSYTLNTSTDAYREKRIALQVSNRNWPASMQAELQAVLVPSFPQQLPLLLLQFELVS